MRPPLQMTLQPLLETVFIVVAMVTAGATGHDIEYEGRAEGDNDVAADNLRRRVEEGMAHEVVAVVGKLESAATQDRRRTV